MSTVKISQLSELTADTDVTSNDLLQIINIEQTSPTYPTGTNRKIKASTLANGLSRLSTVIPQVIQDALAEKVSLENFNSAGLKIAAPVVAASPGINFTLSNITPGSSMDGVTLASGNRVLLKDQTSPAQNGIYVVQTSGSPLRATDFDTLLEINDGYVLVDGGTTLKGSSWVVTSGVEVIGTDPINFTQFSSAISGLSKSAVGLGNVDNTSDVNKPISALTQIALDAKANLSGCTFLGTVTAPTFSGNVTGNVSGSSGSCTGNAATATTAAACTGNAVTATSTVTPTFSGNSVTKDDITTRTETGFYQTASGTTGEGWPVTNDTWQHLIACTHNNITNYYSMQIGGSFYDQEFYGRKTNGSGTQSWTRFVTSANCTSFNSNQANSAISLVGLYSLKSGAMDMRSTWDNRGTVTWSRAIVGEYYEYTLDYSSSNATFKSACEVIEIDHYVPAYIPSFLSSGAYKVISNNTSTSILKFRVKNASLLTGWSNPNVGTGNSGTGLVPFGILKDPWNRFILLHSTLCADTANGGFLRSANDGMLCFINLKTGYQLPGIERQRLRIQSHYGDFTTNVYYTGLLPTTNRQLDYFNGTTNRSRGDGEWFNMTYTNANLDDNFVFYAKTIPIGINTSPRYAHFEIEYITA